MTIMYSFLNRVILITCRKVTHFEDVFLGPSESPYFSTRFDMAPKETREVLIPIQFC